MIHFYQQLSNYEGKLQTVAHKAQTLVQAKKMLNNIRYSYCSGDSLIHDPISGFY